MRFVIYTFFELFGSEEYSKGSSRKWVKALSAFNWKMMRELTIVDRNVETRNFPNRFSPVRSREAPAFIKARRRRARLRVNLEQAPAFRPGS
jgi:hypothetical protein